jgi:hypothetical protein
MTLKHAGTEKLSDYAVDLKPLKAIHEAKIAKRMEIEALIAKDFVLGPVASLPEARKKVLTAQVDQLLDEWESEKDHTGANSEHSETLGRLAKEYSALSQKIIEAQDRQVKEAANHPFEHRIR